MVDPRTKWKKRHFTLKISSRTSDGSVNEPFVHSFLSCCYCILLAAFIYIINHYLIHWISAWPRAPSVQNRIKLSVKSAHRNCWTRELKKKIRDNWVRASEWCRDSQAQMVRLRPVYASSIFISFFRFALLMYVDGAPAPWIFSLKCMYILNKYMKHSHAF